MITIIFMAVMSASFAKEMYSKAPFVTIRKFTDIDSTPVTTITCSAKITILEEVANLWVRVKVGGREGFVLSKLLSASNSECLSKKNRFLLNSISLSSDEIYLWSKLGEHFIEGEINEF